MDTAVACIVDRCRCRSSSEVVTGTDTAADSAWAAAGGAADGAAAATEAGDSAAVAGSVAGVDSSDRVMEEDSEVDDSIKR